MRKAVTFLLLGMPLALAARNPVIRDQFTADPTARVFNNKVYLYPSHDITPPEGQRQDWFCMEDYHVFSSENLTDWTDHGVIVAEQGALGETKLLFHVGTRLRGAQRKVLFLFPVGSC